MAYAVRSTKKGYADKLSLGILPILPSASYALGLPPNPYRAASVITRQDHEVVSLDK